MPTPQFKGSFPVRVRVSEQRTSDGNISYATTDVYMAGNAVTGIIRSTITYSGKTLSLSNINLKTANGLSEVTKTYSGSTNENDPSGGVTPGLAVYEVDASLAEEAISTHPAFTSATGIYASSIVSASGGAITRSFNGEMSSTSGGAIFNQDGIFEDFSKNAQNNFFGVKSYLSPQVSFRRIYTSKNAPSTTASQQLAYIYSNPTGQEPVIPSGRNWLKTSLSWKGSGGQNGSYQITEEYRMSGPNGWNNTIYYTA